MVLCELEGQRQRQLAEWLGTMRRLFVVLESQRSI